MKPFLLCLTLLALAGLCAQEIPLCDLSQDPLATGLTARSATIAKVPEGWKIDYPAWHEGEEEWPAIILDLGKGLLQTDWQQRKFLCFTLFNPGEAFSIELRLDDANVDTATQRFELAAHEATVCYLPTESLLDREMLGHQMISWNLFLSRPEEPHTVILQQLVLNDEPYTTASWLQVSRRLAHKFQLAIDALQREKSSAYRTARIAQLAELKEFMTNTEKAVEQREWHEKHTPPKPEHLVQAAKFFARSKPEGKPGVAILPATLKLRTEQFPRNDQLLKELRIAAARGEGENLKLLIYAGAERLSGVTVSTTVLTNQADGSVLAPVLNVVGYVPVTKPTIAPYGFGEKGRFPDPLCPNAPFDLEPFTNQAVWFTVNVPETATPGTYSGQVTVDFANETRLLPAKVVVHDVLLPRHGQLKTCWIHRNEGKKPQYYGENWTRELQEAWFRQCIQYRLDADEWDSSDILPWNTVFTTGEDGKVVADWAKWDAAYDRWYALGRNTFISLHSPNVYHENPIPDQDDERSQRLRLLEQHLVERGIYDNFYMYFFDEPQPKFAEGIKKICQWVHRQGSHLNLLLTSCNNNEATYFDDIDIFAPHADIFDPAFGEKCKAAGKKYWAYTCIGTLMSTYPDSWKIDYYGTGHRALGWWLYKFGAQGYLYWGLDYWMVNPWENAETYPTGNGDGSLFYPAPDHQSLPYPALRAALVRDGFEDYELLCLLARKYPGKRSRKIRNLLDAKDIITDIQNHNLGLPGIFQRISRRIQNHYHQDSDLLLIQRHRELLELLEK
ncbi:MAG: DUF4091 domain-containing protein [Victivallales bacterium]|nr:DUF4091 domain-containing protein [Victivallales bacterium]